MKVGILKEIKVKEKRVCIIPAGVLAMHRAGHTILVEKSAGEGSGYSDDVMPANVFPSCQILRFLENT